MNINLTLEQEKVVEEVIAEPLQALREKERSVTPVSNRAQREAVREMLSFVEKNRSRSI